MKKDYKPHKAPVKRYLQGAPDYVLSVHKQTPSIDPETMQVRPGTHRYAILLSEPFWHDDLGSDAPYIACDETGSSFRMGYIASSRRDDVGRKCQWLELPGIVRTRIQDYLESLDLRNNLEEPDGVLLVGALSDEAGPGYIVWMCIEGQPPYVVINEDGYLIDDGVMPNTEYRQKLVYSGAVRQEWIDLPQSVRDTILNLIDHPQIPQDSDGMYMPMV